ncbi:MAG: hypothetical protein EU536_03720 [Promethearchaeota archaeon]|nr:MAG: hypothetical protein EU536_03720 [Candidatus Lokiarchaeota archaeon]
MKLVDLSRKAVSLLKDAGEKGINKIELAEKLKVPRRRVYDIIAILRSTELIEYKREKGGTTIFWKSIPSIESLSVPVDPSANIEQQKSEISKLERENADLKDKIKRMREDLAKGTSEKTTKKQQFDTSEIAVRAAKSLKISEVVSSGIEVIIKANGKGIIVEPKS